jgi:hypothetical protein
MCTFRQKKEMLKVLSNMMVDITNFVDCNPIRLWNS